LSQDCSSDLLGVQPVGLAVHVSGQPIGAVDLDHPNGLGGQEPGQRGAEGAGALDPYRDDLAVLLDPGQQGFVAAVVDRKLAVAQQAALVIDRGGVVRVLVGVDATDHGDHRCGCWPAARMGCHAGCAPPLGLI
jgi:hypothetical protein